MMKKLHLNIVSPEKELFNGEVESVTLPGTMGSFSILPQHAPIVSSLGTGKLIYATDGEEHELDIQSGFVEMSNGRVAVCIEQQQAIKKLKIKNYQEITRAALLHDFFKSDEVKENIFVNHPLKALENAENNFLLDAKQQNIIASHMFPVTKVMPSNIGSWTVTVVDKIVATYECCLLYTSPSPRDQA